jgi:outer membrane protein OmpA-like peptidoglycan-associated protein
MPTRPIGRWRARYWAAVLLVAATPACVTAVAAEPQERTATDLRASLFGRADAALAAANQADAAVLAPSGYARGARLYAEADETLNEGGNIESIQRDLAEAEELLATAARAATAATRFFELPLRARQRAQFAGANRYAEAEWTEAEEAMVDAAERFERGREESAEKAKAGVIERYEAAELAAIKANYLQQTRNLLEQADELRARRVAPTAWEQANRLLAEAEAALNEDRYDTDRPRNLAQMAEQNAYQAVYVAQLERGIRKGDTSLEQIVMDWESEMRKVADLLEIPVQFDAGPEGAVIQINRAIDALQSELNDLRQGVAERDAQIAGLQQELGGKTESLARVNQILARQERLRARVAKIQTLFTTQEASVLRQDDAVIIRLIGLNFASGSSTLTREHQPLLTKVRTALAEFPESTVVIEGHTDSFGSDTANQQLSQSRANAVMQYLVGAAAISPVTSTALGFGESRPVATNETPDGRRRNRRIDIVIHPQG